MWGSLWDAGCQKGASLFRTRAPHVQVGRVSWKLGGRGQSVVTWVPSVLPRTWSQSCPRGGQAH